MCFSCLAYCPDQNANKPNVTASKTTSWQTWRHSDNKYVKKRRASKPDLIEICAELIINSSLSGFLQFIEDPDNIANWLDNVDSLELKRHSITENTLTIFFNAFWPVDARVMKIKSTIKQLPNLSIQILITDLSEHVNSSTQAIPVTVHSASWFIKPVAANKLHIRYQFVADANGNLPHWLANKVSLKSIWRTLSNIEQQLPRSKYQALAHPAIKEFTMKSSQTQ